MACILNIYPQLWKAAPGCFVVCKLDSWMLTENYSFICGEPDWTAASPYTIQGLPLRLIKD